MSVRDSSWAIGERALKNTNADTDRMCHPPWGIVPRPPRWGRHQYLRFSGCQHGGLFTRAIDPFCPWMCIAGVCTGAHAHGQFVPPVYDCPVLPRRAGTMRQQGTVFSNASNVTLPSSPRNASVHLFHAQCSRAFVSVSVVVRHGAGVPRSPRAIRRAPGTSFGARSHKGACASSGAIGVACLTGPTSRRGGRA
jgi:hypothetical protein